MKCILGLLALLAVLAWTEAGVMKRVSGDNNDEDEGGLTVTELLEKANGNLNCNQVGIKIDGGIARSRRRTLRNAMPCTQHDRMWPRAIDGNVYIPYVIANHYSSDELDVIKTGINSFTYSTCIRFVPRTDQRDYLFIQSLDGCYSCVGQQGSGQIVSLSRQGCMHHGIIQHELLHALGFSHEHCRSDRDQHIRVLLQNVIKGQDYNFNKAETLNEGTPYDYGSVMHYGRMAFSKDKTNPTMVAVPDPGVVFGTAQQMSLNDINRINLLYCRK